MTSVSFSHTDTADDSIYYYPKNSSIGLVEVKPADGAAVSVWLPQLPALQLAESLIMDNLTHEEGAMLLTILRNKIKAVENTPTTEERNAIIEKYGFGLPFGILSKSIQNLIDDTIRDNK